MPKRLKKAESNAKKAEKAALNAKKDKKNHKNHKKCSSGQLSFLETYSALTEML